MNESENVQEDLKNVEETPLNPENPSFEGEISESSESGKGSPDGSKDLKHQQHFEKFQEDLSQIQDPEEKLLFTIEFMKDSLSQSGTPHFKSFWEAREVCLQLFKENISPATRASTWGQYNELSKEARRLKEILDEQSAFAVEQIEIAIKALEEDVTHFQDHLEKMPKIGFEEIEKVLGSRVAQYESLQKELNLLNVQASRINALRKELVRTEMRVRQKNKFFQRLSAAGDQVFPKRKDLIKEVSQKFIEDVDRFIVNNFENNDTNESLFILREEIKALQNMAKILTLNTHSFTHTRMRLSHCWDEIKVHEKERKKERAQLKAAFKQNLEDVLSQLKEFAATLEDPNTSTSQASKKLDEISFYARGLDLGREEQRIVREEIQSIKKGLHAKIQAEEQARLHEGHERENARLNKIKELKQQIEGLFDQQETLNIEEIISERDKIVQKASTLQMTKIEKQEIDRQLKSLRDFISESKERSLISLSEDDRESLEQMREILRQRKERRQESKSQIETLKRSNGASGLDFAQAMEYNSQINSEKERLEKINQSIKEIELKIAELEES